MKLNRLSIKITLFVGVLITVAVFVIAGVIIVTERRQIREQILNDSIILADYASGSIYNDYIQFYTHPSDSDFEKHKELFLRRISNNSDIKQVKLIGVNGVVLFDSEEFETGKHQGAERKLSADDPILSLVKTSGLSVRESDNGIEVVRSIDELSDTHIISAYYSVSYDSVQSALVELYRNVAIFLIPILAMSTISALFLSFSITKPLANLASAVKRLQKGETGISVDIKSSDEVGQLTQAFNQMSSELALQIRTVKQGQAKLSASINSLSVGFIMAGLKGEIIMMNPVAQKIIGQKEQLSSLSQIKTHTQDTFTLDEMHKECIHQNRSVTKREVEYKQRFFDILMTPIIDKNSNMCIGVVVLLNDITEAKILDRSKDEFFSIASHELRTPLTAIMGNVDILHDYYKEKVKDPEINEIIEDIEKSSERMINIVNDFLDLSRLEVGNIEFKNEVVEVEKFIDDTLQEFQVMSSRKKLYLEFVKPETALPPVFADRDKSRQVLINLIGNGFKFTEKGGVLIKAKLDEKFVTITVTDTGMGISPENQKYLFRKFQQAGDSIYARDVTQGTGLGLYISKLIVEGMGGKIWLEESTSGKGSTFSFTLPINKNDKNTTS